MNTSEHVVDSNIYIIYKHRIGYNIRIIAEYKN